MIITIDGPSGTGKTTVAKEVAKALGFAYFDTGAMYRALTWLMLKNQSIGQIHKLSSSVLRNFTFALLANLNAIT